MLGLCLEIGVRDAQVMVSTQLLVLIKHANTKTSKARRPRIVICPHCGVEIALVSKLIYIFTNIRS